MVQTTSSLTQRCDACGSMPVERPYGTCCSICGLELIKVRYLCDYSETTIKVDGDYRQTHSIGKIRMLGKPIERNKKYHNLQRLNTKHSRDLYYHDLLIVRGHFNLSDYEFNEWNYQISKLKIPPFQRFRYWIIALHQVIYERKTLEEICVLFRYLKHETYPKKIRKLMRDNNIKMPQKNWTNQFLVLLFPTYSRIYDYVRPEIPYLYYNYKMKQELYMSERYNAAIRIYCGMKDHVSITKTRFCKIAQLGQSQFSTMLRGIKKQ